MKHCLLQNAAAVSNIGCEKEPFESEKKMKQT